MRGARIFELGVLAARAVRRDADNVLLESVVPVQSQLLAAHRRANESAKEPNADLSEDVRGQEAQS